MKPKSLALKPILSILIATSLGIIDAACNVASSKSLDLLFMSEIDPTWNDDTLSYFFTRSSIV